MKAGMSSHKQYKSNDRQDQLALEFGKNNSHSAQQVLTEHCEIAKAVRQLSELSSMSFEDYLTCAAKLDEAAIEVPSRTALQALFFVADHKLAAGTLSVIDAISMFSLDTTVPLRPFRCLDPCLQSILPGGADTTHTGLVWGLCAIVLLHFMKLPGRNYEAGLVAKALKHCCWVQKGKPSSANWFPSRSPVARTWPSWITDMEDAGDAVMVLINGDITRSKMGALHRVLHATTPALVLLASIIEKEPWAGMARKLYNDSELHHRPQITESLRACALHPAVWALAAANVPDWKEKLRPGSTQELEEKLWTVLLNAWGKLDKDDAAGCRSLLERLQLARSLTAPNRPADTKLNAMQAFAPKPQLLFSSQALQPAHFSRSPCAHVSPHPVAHT